MHHLRFNLQTIMDTASVLVPQEFNGLFQSERQCLTPSMWSGCRIVCVEFTCRRHVPIYDLIIPQRCLWGEFHCKVCLSWSRPAQEAAKWCLQHQAAGHTVRATRTHYFITLHHHVHLHEFASTYCEHACDKQLNSERSHDVNRQTRILTWLKSEGESIEGLTPEALRNGRAVNSFDSALWMQGLTHQHPRNNQIHWYNSKEHTGEAADHAGTWEEESLWGSDEHGEEHDRILHCLRLCFGCRGSRYK